MAREYPSYIYTNESETFSKGEFLVRTLKPRYIAKIIHNGGQPEIRILEWFDDWNSIPNFDLDKYKKHALHWYNARHR